MSEELLFKSLIFTSIILFICGITVIASVISYRKTIRNRLKNINNDISILNDAINNLHGKIDQQNTQLDQTAVNDNSFQFSALRIDPRDKIQTDILLNDISVDDVMKKGVSDVLYGFGVLLLIIGLILLIINIKIKI